MISITGQPRCIYLNSSHQQSAFCSNALGSRKYDGCLLIFKCLAIQLAQMLSNLFLLIAGFQYLLDVNATGHSYVFPIFILIALSAVKEILEGFKRRRTANLVNNSVTQVLREGHMMQLEWKQVRVGDVVMVEEGHVFPADMVILSSSEPSGLAYIETSKLNGKTNLQAKQAPSISANFTTVDKLMSLDAMIECEEPNKDFDSFVGHIKIQEVEAALSSNELLPRGAQLRDTDWIFGAVVYTGHDSKVFLNSNTVPIQSSNGRSAILVAVFMTLMLFGGTGAIVFKYFYHDELLDLSFIANTNFIRNALMFVIIYHNLIPTSLELSMELIHFFQAFDINNDIEMYDDVTDTGAEVRTSELNEELGQVQYVMVDKTGTLTRTQMKLRRCSVLGFSYGNESDKVFNDERLIERYSNDDVLHQKEGIVAHFFNMLTICNSVMPEWSNDLLCYHGSSPDECALVQNAAALGIVLYARTSEYVVVDKLNSFKTYHILHTFQFNSTRKVMSMIIRTENNEYILYAKGDESEIIKRLRGDQVTSLEKEKDNLREYASKGFRTLCFGFRRLRTHAYFKWQHRFTAALSDVPCDHELVQRIVDELEDQLMLAGIIALEEELQEYVPETVGALKNAGINVWMLTGDKKEPAINVAKSSALVAHDTKLYVIDSDADIPSINVSSYEHKFALLINGDYVKDAMSKDRRDFLEDILLRAQSVICYRMKPSQKAAMVEFVRKMTNSVVLAVGDGANDVAMIQAANVGVAIAGQERREAALASDYSIPQFHFLRRLLLVHGAWSRSRTMKVIVYNFYKNIRFFTIALLFTYFSIFSIETVFDRWLVAFFNVVFIAFPPILMRVFDRPVATGDVQEDSILYRDFQDMSFSYWSFLQCIVMSVWHPIMLFLLTCFTMDHSVTSEAGMVFDWLMLGCSAYTYLAVTISLKLILETNDLKKLVITMPLKSLASWITFVIFYFTIYAWLPADVDMVATAQSVMTSWILWVGLVFIPIATLILDLAIKGIQELLPLQHYQGDVHVNDNRRPVVHRP